MSRTTGKPIRLNRAVSTMGKISRREADRAIESGRVTVNGKVEKRPGILVDIEKDHIKLDGKLLKVIRGHIYLVLNKPAGFIVSEQPEDPRCVMNLLRGVKRRVFYVGRLDVNSEGVLLFTSDGELAHKLMRPEYRIDRVYRVKVRGIPDQADISRILKGVPILHNKRVVKVRARCRIDKSLKSNAWLLVRITEGKTREIRQIMERIGHPAIRLKRISYGGIKAQGLKPGEFRYLKEEEIRRLRMMTGLSI